MGSNLGAASSSPAAKTAPARLPLTSADPLASRYEELKVLFPMAVTDGRIDLEKLRALMGEGAASGPERYGLTWADKSDALKTLRQQTTATLLPAPSESEKWGTTGNAIIEGDNLEVLKVALRKERYLSEEFRELWERISQKTRYRVDFPTEALVAKAVSAFKDEPEVSAPQISVTRSQVRFSAEG